MGEISLEGFAGVAVQPPTEREFGQFAARQERELGGTADRVFSPQNQSEAVRRLHQKRMEIQALMERVGGKPWSVVNLMPFPLNVNGVLHARMAGAGGEPGPECPVGAPFLQEESEGVGVG